MKPENYQLPMSKLMTIVERKVLLFWSTSLIFEEQVLVRTDENPAR